MIYDKFLQIQFFKKGTDNQVEVWAKTQIGISQMRISKDQ